MRWWAWTVGFWFAPDSGLPEMSAEIAEKHQLLGMKKINNQYNMLHSSSSAYV